MERGPNIFDFATSELSQDAFLCWLSIWANPKYSSINADLHKLGVDFISACFAKYEQTIPEPITSVEVRKQVDGLDILVTVNSTYAILIEDKIYTSEHSDQLERYKEAIKNRGYNNQFPIYYKTINQSNIDNVLNAGYKLFSRQEMLDLLGTYVKEGIKDTILNDYYVYLSNIEEQIQSYLELTDWHYNSWIGFYTDLKERLQRLQVWSNWGYVSNPNGGFFGFWWYFGGNEICEQYLQLEEDKLCFKIRVYDKDRRAELREFWYNRIINEAQKEGLEVQKPVRFGNGEFMTVAILGHEYRIFTDGKLDMEKTVAELHAAEKILDSVRT